MDATNIGSDRGAVTDILEHFGTRGMRWGVRKDGSNPAHGTTSVVVTNHTPKVGSLTVDATKQTAMIISAKKATSEQKSSISKAIKRDLSSYEQAWEIKTQNEAQARKQYEETGTADVMKVRNIKHDDILEHVGIRGMRWGVRRENPSGGGGGRESVTAKIKPGKGIVKIKGGGGRLPSEDALNAAAYKQRAAKSTVSSLDNKELQSLVTRMKLEQQYSALAAQPKSNGRKFADEIATNEVKSLALRGKQGPILAAIGGLIAARGIQVGLKNTAKTAATNTVSTVAKSATSGVVSKTIVTKSATAAGSKVASSIISTGVTKAAYSAYPTITSRAGSLVTAHAMHSVVKLPFMAGAAPRMAGSVPVLMIRAGAKLI